MGGDNAQDQRVLNTKNQESHIVTKLDCVNPTQARLYFYLFGFFETGFLRVALAGLGLIP